MFIINRIELSNPRIQLSNQNENFTYDNYQSSLIKSLINIANKNISQDINLNIIYDTNFFICNVNKEINVNGWSSLFSLFISLIKYNDESGTSSNTYEVDKNDRLSLYLEKNFSIISLLKLGDPSPLTIISVCS